MPGFEFGVGHAGSPSGRTTPQIRPHTHSLSLSQPGGLLSPQPSAVHALPAPQGGPGLRLFCLCLPDPQCSRAPSPVFWLLSLPALSASSLNPGCCFLLPTLTAHTRCPQALPNSPAPPSSSLSPGAGVVAAQTLSSDPTNVLRVTWKKDRQKPWGAQQDPVLVCSGKAERWGETLASPVTPGPHCTSCCLWLAPVSPFGSEIRLQVSRSALHCRPPADPC